MKHLFVFRVSGLSEEQFVTRTMYPWMQISLGSLYRVHAVELIRKPDRCK